MSQIFDTIFLSASGIYFPRKINSRKNIIWWIWKVLTDLLTFLQFLTTLIGCILSIGTNDIGLMVSSFFCPNVLFQQLLWSLHLQWLHSTEAQEILDLLSSPVAYNKDHPGCFPALIQLQKNKKPMVIGASRVIVEIILISTVMVELFMANLKDSSIILPAFAWYPFDVSPLAIYRFIVIFQTLAIIANSAKMGAMECLFLQMISTISNRIRVLVDVLENWPVHEQGEDAEKLMLWWVTQHQITLKAGHMLRKLFSPLLFAAYFMIFSNLIISILPFTLEVNYAAMQKNMIVAAAIGFLLHLYVLSIFADQLNEMEGLIYKAGYQPSLVFGKRNISKAILMIFRRSRKNTRLAAYTVYPLSSESFGLLVKATASYILTILQMKQSQKE